MDFPESQIGTIGEYYVAYDIANQGYSLFFVNEGLSYDMVIDINNILYRLQVKTRSSVTKYKHQKTPSYRFRIWKTRENSTSHYLKFDCDIFAFVGLDIKKVAYFTTSELSRPDGKVQTRITLRSKAQNLNKKYTYLKYFEDYSTIERIKTVLSK